MIMCPDKVNSNGQSLKFNGAKGMMRTSSLTFRVERCTKESYCKSEEEINEYIEDINVETWVI